MQDWAKTFDAPVWLHAADRDWVMRDSPWIRLWEGEEHALLPGVTLLRLGGHFAGGTVLYQDEGEGTILTGDILQITPGADAVSFMWSYPNMLPLSKGRIGSAMPMRLCNVREQNISPAWHLVESSEGEAPPHQSPLVEFCFIDFA